MQYDSWTLTPWEELSSYVDTSDEELEDGRRRLHSLGAPSGALSLQWDGEDEVTVLEIDPWKTWSPPTPPQVSSEASRTVATRQVHNRSRRNSWLEAISEGNVEAIEEETRNEVESLQRIEEEHDSERCINMCWICRAIVERSSKA